MNRRQAIGTTLKAAAVASVLRTERAAAQDAGAKAPAEGSTIHLNPASGLDTNSGTQGSPLRTLAEAARRVNQSSGRRADDRRPRRGHLPDRRDDAAEAREPLRSPRTSG